MIRQGAIVERKRIRGVVTYVGPLIVIIQWADDGQPEAYGINYFRHLAKIKGWRIHANQHHTRDVIPDQR